MDEQAALDDLETFAQNWDNKYPKIAKSWRENWANLSTYFGRDLNIVVLLQIITDAAMSFIRMLLIDLLNCR